MSESFNPYHKWLDLPSESSNPSYYQMLGLPEGESSGSRIAEAADRAIARVRSFKPGPHAREWSRLIDELKASKECLLDPAIKAEYDRCLAQGKEQPKLGDEKRGLAAPTHVKAPVNVDRLPPGMAPRLAPQAEGPAAIVPAVPTAAAAAPEAPAASIVPASVDNLLPTASYSTSEPMAAATTPPAWGVPAPGYATPGYAPAGYGAPLAVDPMAPVSSLPMPAQPIPQQALVTQAMYPAATYATPASAYPAAMPSPVPAGYDSPALSLGGGQSALQAASARRAARARRNVTAAAIAGCLLIAIAAVMYANRHAILAQLDPQFVAQNPAEPERVDTSGDDSPPVQPVEAKGDRGKTSEDPPMPVVAPAAAPQPEPMPEPAPTPEPASEPVPEPKPETKPEVKPESAPAPTPEPAPMPVVMPTKAELMTLGKALTQGRSALAKQDFVAADQAIAEAEGLAKLPEHQEMAARLKEVASYVKQFRNAVDQALKALQPGAEIKVGNSTMVVVVQVSEDRLTIRRAGGNVTYAIGEIPAGLTMALADSWLNENDPVNRVIRGSYFAVAEGAEEVHREKARKYWDEAQSAGIDIKHLLPFLTDKYDLENQMQATKPDASQ
jgi:outer membrane biosynthesis protein TonB